MATITSNGTGGGLWSAGATWVGGVAPVDDDTVVIASGDTVIFNVDQSGFANGINGMTITGTLTVSTTTSSYIKIKNATNITGSGTLNMGTSGAGAIPYAVKSSLVFSFTNNRIDASSGLTLNAYGTPPTNKFALTTGSEAAGQTRIEIDRDLSTDNWSVGDTVWIVDISGYDTEERTIAAINTSYIDITSGITNAKNAGSYVFLVTRNVYLKSGTTHNIFRNFQVSKLNLNDCYVSSYSSSGETNLCAVFNNVVINSGSNFGPVSYGSYFLDSCVIKSGCNSSIAAPINGSDYVMLRDCYLVGSKSCAYGVNNLSLENCKIIGNESPFNVIKNLNMSNSTATNNTNLLTSTTGKLFNVEMTDVTNEHSTYTEIRDIYSNCQSEDHDGVDGAFKAWCKGGVVTSQTSVMPSGYTLAYLLDPESATYPVFFTKQFSVEPGKTVNIEVQLRKDASMAYLPRVYLMNSISNPIAGATPVDTFTMTDSTDTWESDTFTIDNSAGTTDKDYTLWFLAKNASGNVYSAYDITTQGGGGGSVKILPIGGRVGL